VSFGSAGVGTSQHLSGELFNIATGTRMVHVPYRGAAQAMPDLLSGQIQVMFVSIPEASTHVRSGALRALGVTSKERAGSLPDIAPIAEQGYPDFNVTAWFGVAAPKGTPMEIVRKYNAAIRAILAKPEIKQRFAATGLDLETNSPEDFAAYIKAEIAKWTPVVKASGAKID
jgi:tripartite-type tricarboxylate transporter receptor subunit TctC